MTATQRTFIAVEISDEVRQALAKLQRELREFRASASWTKIENIHLTLKFLGDVTVDRLPAVADAVAHACRGRRRFGFDVVGVGAFPNLQRARVLWAGISDSDDRLSDLADGIDTQLFSLGFTREKRKFKPHLTMARVRAPLSQEFKQYFDALEFLAGSVEVHEVIVMASDLKPTGAVYTPLVRVKLE